MAPGDRRRCSHSQSIPEAEVPSLISIAALALSPEGPSLTGPSEADSSDIIILFI